MTHTRRDVEHVVSVLAATTLFLLLAGVAGFYLALASLGFPWWATTMLLLALMLIRHRFFRE